MIYSRILYEPSLDMYKLYVGELFSFSPIQPVLVYHLHFGTFVQLLVY